MADERELGELGARLAAMDESFKDFRSECRAAFSRLEHAPGPDGPGTLPTAAYSELGGVPSLMQAMELADQHPELYFGGL